MVVAEWRPEGKLLANRKEENERGFSNGCELSSSEYYLSFGAVWRLRVEGETPAGIHTSILAAHETNLYVRLSPDKAELAGVSGRA